jgi:dipeptide/tripeptide permease
VPAVIDETRTDDGMRSFPRTFWVANVMELFERAAYYGMMSVLAVYLRMKTADGGLGFSETSVGFLQSIMLTLTYVMPILGGAIAERYGYKRFLMLAFAVLTVGYFASGRVTSYGLIFLTLLLIAVGSGLFKPILSGTITRTSNDGNRSLGFGIYYWMINLGAFLSPILVSYLKGFSWSYVFMASAAWSAAMLVLTMIFYKEPERPASAKGLGETLSGLEVRAHDRRLFGILAPLLPDVQYDALVHGRLREYDPGRPVPHFHRALLRELEETHFRRRVHTSLEAGAIILLQVVVSRIVKNLRALPTMIGGIVIGTAGFILLSISGNAWVFIISIAVFSIGEMTCHPKYFSYVGQIAPKDKVAVYMGYSFLYGIMGSLVGSNLGAILYKKVAKGMNQPRLFWAIFSMIGILTAVALAIYDHYLSPEGSETPHVST